MGKLKDSYSSKIYMTRNNVSEVMSSYYNSIFEVLVSVSDYDRGGVLQTQMLKLFDLLVNY